MALLRLNLNNTIFPLRPGMTVIGRAEECNVIVDTVGDLSRQHCAISVFEDGTTVARDLGSRNGSFINNERMGEAEIRLKNGDVVRLGKYVEFVFEDSKRGSPRASGAAARRQDRGASQERVLLSDLMDDGRKTQKLQVPESSTFSTLDGEEIPEEAQGAILDFVKAARKTLRTIDDED
ncbi:MAG: pSer/pThr/pTyr-binding forkhead associated (FHA) protein [Rhodothermales bacterium]|jgi:pSer/pThr/pTyr-binding forkhead associated (FHA) protein